MGMFLTFGHHGPSLEALWKCLSALPSQPQCPGAACSSTLFGSCSHHLESVIFESWYANHQLLQWHYLYIPLLKWGRWYFSHCVVISKVPDTDENTLLDGLLMASNSLIVLSLVQNVKLGTGETDVTPVNGVIHHQQHIQGSSCFQDSWGLGC